MGKVPHVDATHNSENDEMCDYLHRRDGSSIYYYRRRIPDDLRVHYKNKSELYFSLRTADKAEARLRVLEQAAQHEREFKAHRQRLSNVSPQDRELDELAAYCANPSAFPSPSPSRPAPTEKELYQELLDAEEFSRQEQEWEYALEEVRGELQTANLRLKAMRQVLAEDAAEGHPEGFAALAGVIPGLGQGMVQAVAAVAPVAQPDAPVLSIIVDDFLSRQDQSKAMFKKYKAILSAFLEVVGDKPCSQLRQNEIDGFFDLMCCLPPRWTDQKRKQEVSLRELSEQDWQECISQATFEDGYIGAFRPFLTEARRRYGDQGFPPNLTTNGIKYSGDREAGSQKQRHIKFDELVRLFEGPEMRGFAQQPDLHHCYWLPLVGLYTGARVNEVCQINPQVDIREEDGIWFFDFTSKSEGDDRIRKRIKNKGSHRKVPIHPKLIELGFLSYVDAVKGKGCKLLFAQWTPSKGRASAAAEKWFREFLVALGLRDETHGARLVGFHSFRRTLLNHGKNNQIEHVDWLTGHAPPGVSSVVANYQGEAELPKKLEILSVFDFGLSFPEPKLAA